MPVRRRWIAWPILLFLLVIPGCPAGDPEPTAPPADESSAPELDPCPDENAWLDALGRARKNDTVAEFTTQVVEREARCPGDWRPPWILGEIAYRGRAEDSLDRAHAHARRARELARDIENPVGIARSANRLGAIALRRQDYPASREAYVMALDNASLAGRDDLAAFYHNNFAGMLLESGEIASALEHLDRAIAGLRALEMDGSARRASYNRAIILKNTGSLTEAAEILDQVFTEATAIGDSRWRDRICVARADLHRSLEQFEESERWFALVGSDHPKVSTAARLGQGRSRLATGRYDEAIELLRSVDVEGADLPDQTLARIFLGEALFRGGGRDEAISVLSDVVAETETGGIPEHRWLSRALLSKAILAGDGGDAGVDDLLRDALHILESQADGLDPRRSGLGYLRERTEPFADLAARLAEQAQHEELLGVMEQAHARSLRRFTEQEGRRIPAVTSLAILRRSLKPHEVLLSFLIGTDRGAALLVHRDEVRSRAIPGWSTLRPLTTRYRNALRRPLLVREAQQRPMQDLDRDIGVGVELYQLLLGDLTSSVEKAERWYVVADQDLNLVPFAALPTGTTGGVPTFVAEQHEVARLPLAGAIPRTHETHAPVLLAGDPRFSAGADFTRLPLAQRELTTLRTLWGETEPETLWADQFTRDRLDRLDLGRFGTLHFATHALASSSDPRRCAVLLSDGDRWTVPEIARLDLDGSLVILSACQTGEGEIVPGEGVVGLTWAFLQAGASGVTASLWSVEDTSTEMLMTAYHRGLRDDGDAVRALALARRHVSATQPHPAYWAPFVVVLRPQD
ncbi:MAG: CHAT domain-containing protein [Acidobacteriota bacterium]|nr:CHAT domain-containing protein [Acidobacteriota bacterium]